MLLTAVLASCSVARYLPPGERLYAGADFRFASDSLVTGNQEKELRDKLKEIVRPRPNKRLLGFPYKVGLYYAVGDPRREGDFRSWFRRKFGEAPVLASAQATRVNTSIFTNELHNEGFFRSAVTGQLIEKGQQARALYTLRVAPRYQLDSIVHWSDSSYRVRQVLASLQNRSLLRKGQPFRLENIRLEQQRLSQQMQQRGYYYFSPSYIAVLADSAVGKRGIKLYLTTRPDMPAAARVPYRIHNIFVYPNYSFTGADTLGTDPAARLPGFYVSDSTHRFNDRLFRDAIALRPGERYSSRRHDLSVARLVNLGVFKFVRNRFEAHSLGDTAVLDAYYYLTPYQKKAIQAEAAAVSRSNNLAGTQLSFSWRNRNLWRRAELLTVRATGGTDFQVGAFDQGIVNYRYGLEASLIVPRLVTPIRIPYDRWEVLPKTEYRLGFNNLVRRGFYTLTSFYASMGYTWRSSRQFEHSFQPVSLNYVRSGNFGDKFYASLADTTDPNAFYRNIQILTLDQLIFGSLYTLNYTPLSLQRSAKHSYRLGFTAESAGGLLSLLRPRPDTSGIRSLFGVPYSQYLLLSLDNRYSYHLTPRLTLATRLYGGVGIPYGNSAYLPLVKQLFSGGVNSLRGFRPRTVGPGVSTRALNAETIYFQDGGGDIKLEANAELRFNLTDLFQLAAFVDAGNVWMKKDESVYGPGTVFSRDFLRQLAIDGGVGLRLDFTYFLLRLDLATPFRKPWLPPGQRSVLGQIQPFKRDWRQENLILNIAVGYPF